MREKLEHANGCAAVHIGVLRRVVVVNDDNGVIELINPAITEASTETQDVLEGSIAPVIVLGAVFSLEDLNDIDEYPRTVYKALQRHRYAALRI